ncbi:CoF synthetase [Paracoccaceae bacterium GXU_MW_L88]
MTAALHLLRETLPAFLQTRWRTRSALSREAFLRWQDAQITEWLRRDLPRAPFYADRHPATLADLPIIDKADVMGDFAAFNTAGLSADAVWERIDRNIEGRLIAGASTGTSGQRGLFLISRVESFRWLGVLLAKAIPDLLLRRHRIALILPRNARLYDAASAAGPITLQFFPTDHDPAEWRAELERFAPSIVIATPHMLRLMAEAGHSIAPQRIFAAAETLDPQDRGLIEAHFGPLRQIYMATEGLLAVSCAHGTLHLCEDSTHFELEEAEGGLVSPLITGFRRQVQIMARYRMNDLLRMAAPCPCGSPLRAVAEVVGRQDDIFRLGPSGAVRITPDTLRDAVLAASPAVTDFRVIQTGAAQVELRLPEAVEAGAKDAVEAALRAVFSARGVSPEISRHTLDPRPKGGKLRRVMRRSGA